MRDNVKGFGGVLPSHPYGCAESADTSAEPGHDAGRGGPPTGLAPQCQAGKGTHGNFPALAEMSRKTGSLSQCGVRGYAAAMAKEGAELIIGLVAPMGTNTSDLASAVQAPRS